MTIEDGIVFDGVIHVVSNVLIPPKSVGGVAQEWNGEELEVEDLKERLTVTEEDDKQDDGQNDEEHEAFWRTYL